MGFQLCFPAIMFCVHDSFYLFHAKSSVCNNFNSYFHIQYTHSPESRSLVGCFTEHIIQKQYTSCIQF